MSSNVISIFFFILSFIPSSFSLSFDLSTIGNQDVNLSGDADISKDGILVTPSDRYSGSGDKVGRAIYKEHLHLWDRATGNLTDFTTHFTFLIIANDSRDFGDGLSFFLAPPNSTILPNSTGGGLGLARNTFIPGNTSSEAFVAVEFDTYPKGQWDPLYPHVGIDINSVDSTVTAEWKQNFTLGKDTEAWITYTAITKNLTVNFTNYDLYLDQYVLTSLSYVVDLRDYLPEYVIFGFSASTGASFEKNNVKSWKFNSTELQVEPEPPPSSPQPSPLPSPQPSSMPITFSSKKSKKLWLIIGLSVGGLILILLLPFAGYYIWKKYNANESGYWDFIDPSMDQEFRRSSGPREFSFEQLCDATNQFSEDEKLGEGGFGGVYRGSLRELNLYVAVKRVSKGSGQGVKEYQSEVTIISQLMHKNLVKLLGWCHKRRGELLLVYEFMVNGSLDSNLFRREAGLAWSLRYGIAKGLASALLYLHEEGERCVLHRDIKSSNIMLDSDFNAKLGDFGLARLVDHEKGAQTTIVAGTMGYMAPEYALSGQATKESDIYSFGVVLLEIACGRTAVTNGAQGKQVLLVEVVWGHYGEGKELDAADPNLDMEFDCEEMKRLIVVGLCCVHPDASYRPSIRQALRLLDFEAQLPDLPHKMPVFTYGGVSDQLSQNSFTHSSSITSSSGGSTTALLA